MGYLRVCTCCFVSCFVRVVGCWLFCCCFSCCCCRCRCFSLGSNRFPDIGWIHKYLRVEFSKQIILIIMLHSQHSFRLWLSMHPEYYLETMTDLQTTQRLFDVSNRSVRSDVKKQEVFGKRGETKILHDVISRCLRHHDDHQQEWGCERDHDNLWTDQTNRTREPKWRAMRYVCER